MMKKRQANKKCKKFLISCILILTKTQTKCIINIAIAHGEVAQLARASGSYPAGREFESPLRYHKIKKYKYKK